MTVDERGAVCMLGKIGTLRHSRAGAGEGWERVVG